MDSFISCPPFIRIENLTSESCKLYFKDMLIGILTSMDTFSLETGNIFMLDVAFNKNENTACQLTYLIERQELKDRSDKVSTVLTFQRIDGIVDLTNLDLTSQTIYMSELELKKCNLPSKRFCKIYDDIILAYNANYPDKAYTINDHRETPLTNIEKAYLYYLLIQSRKCTVVSPMHYFNLENEWQHLKYINLMLATSPMKTKVDLLNRGFLFYLNVNACIIDAIIQKKWQSLKSLLNYYESSHLVKYDMIKEFLQKTSEHIPEDVSKILLSLKYKKSPLRKSLISPVALTSPVSPSSTFLTSRF